MVSSKGLDGRPKIQSWPPGSSITVAGYAGFTTGYVVNDSITDVDMSAAAFGDLIGDPTWVQTMAALLLDGATLRLLVTPDTIIPAGTYVETRIHRFEMALVMADPVITGDDDNVRRIFYPRRRF